VRDKRSPGAVTGFTRHACKPPGLHVFATLFHDCCTNTCRVHTLFYSLIIIHIVPNLSLTSPFAFALVLLHRIGNVVLLSTYPPTTRTSRTHLRGWLLFQQNEYISLIFMLGRLGLPHCTIIETAYQPQLPHPDEPNLLSITVKKYSLLRSQVSTRCSGGIVVYGDTLLSRHTRIA